MCLLKKCSIQFRQATEISGAVSSLGVLSNKHIGAALHFLKVVFLKAYLFLKLFTGEQLMTIQLYAFDTPNGRKISIALEEMELTYQVNVINIMKDEQFAADFLKISPNNKIPAIIDSEGPNGQPISVFESGAILIY
jgi:hypothetical protein